MSKSSEYLCKSLFIVAITFSATVVGTAAASTDEHSAKDNPLSEKPVEIYSEGGIEWRQKYKGGICGVFNPATGQVEWRDRYKGGIAGVFNPVTKEIEWRDRYRNGVAGVFNPETEEVEWREKYQVGITGVLAGQPASLSCSSYAIDYKRRRSTGT